VSAPERNPANASDLALAVAIAVTLVPSVLLGWAAGAQALRHGAHRWHLAVSGALLALPLIVVSPRGVAAQAAADALGVVRGTPGGLAPSWALAWAGAGLLARLALRTAPLGVPAGLAVAAANATHGSHLGAELDPARRCQLERAQRRDRQRARDLATRASGESSPDGSPRALMGTRARGENSPPVLAVSISGDLPASWRSGRYVVLPDHAARLPRLVIGRPGAGKSTYLARESYLAGLEPRQLVVLDGKGEERFAAEIEAAYLAGRPGASVHRFPAEPLSCWLGGPAAQLNRLINVWPWTAESDWYRELAVLALRLALSAPERPVSSTAELVGMLDPVQLGRAWADHPIELGLVKSLAPKLPDVQVRVGNLAASLGGLLDGDRALGAADLTIVSVPSMARESDSEAVFRVLMADAQHWAAVRKPVDKPALLVCDEFSAISGARLAAISLLERGRSAGVPVVLAGQSYTSLGSEDERDRLISAAATMVLFASSTPDELARLAGTVQTAEAVLGYEGGRWTGRASVTSRARHKVDPNVIRQLGTGEAVIVASGHAGHVQVVMAPGSQPAAIGPPRRGRLALPRPRRS